MEHDDKNPEVSLGDRLRANIKAEDHRKAEEARLAREAKYQKYRQEREGITKLLDEIKAKISDDILSGKPEVRIKLNRGRRQLFTYTQDKDDVRNPCCRHHRHWENFIQWGEVNGLDLSVVNEHDGMGMESWFVVTATPISR